MPAEEALEDRAFVAGRVDPHLDGEPAAATFGDAVNYAVGRRFGARALGGKVLGVPIKRAYLEKTERYYAKHGAKTIVLARFIPIIRTFAPFVAGVGAMPYATFARYNFIGAALWVGLFTAAGYFFGNIPAVKRNFEFVILAIVCVSILPVCIETLRSKMRKR